MKVIDLVQAWLFLCVAAVVLRNWVYVSSLFPPSIEPTWTAGLFSWHISSTAIYRFPIPM